MRIFNGFEDLQAAVGSTLAVLDHLGGYPVRRDHVGLEGDVEVLQHGRGVDHAREPATLGLDTRDQAIDYMLANSSQSPTDVVNEVDRYVAMPGQALAYKVGDLRIQAARKRAEKALGKNFDIRAFHEQVLMTGALPLEVLDAKIDRWIAGGGK